MRLDLKSIPCATIYDVLKLGDNDIIVINDLTIHRCDLAAIISTFITLTPTSLGSPCLFHIKNNSCINSFKKM